jgi:hypothetical protein
MSPLAGTSFLAMGSGTRLPVTKGTILPLRDGGGMKDRAGKCPMEEGKD